MDAVEVLLTWAPVGSLGQESELRIGWTTTPAIGSVAERSHGIPGLPPGLKQTTVD